MSFCSAVCSCVGFEMALKRIRLYVSDRNGEPFWNNRILMTSSNVVHIGMYEDARFGMMKLNAPILCFTEKHRIWGKMHYNLPKSPESFCIDMWLNVNSPKRCHKALQPIQILWIGHGGRGTTCVSHLQTNSYFKNICIGCVHAIFWNNLIWVKNEFGKIQ